MIVLNLLAALLMTAATVIFLDLTPERIADDISALFTPTRTLVDMSATARGEKRARIITKELRKIKDALSATGKENRFTAVCVASVVGLTAGCMLSFLCDNLLLLPVLSVIFACIPFLYVKSSLSYYNRQVDTELETTLSTISATYMRCDDIVGAVKDALPNIKPPMNGIFKAFVLNATLITSDTKAALLSLKKAIDNDIFREWTDILIACQGDRTLKTSLLPTVNKLSDVRRVNDELSTMLYEARREYYAMTALLVGNIPLLYMLNKEWFFTLIGSVIGKAVLALSGVTLFVTLILMLRFTKPITYRL